MKNRKGYLELFQRILEAGMDVHSLDSFNGTGLIRTQIAAMLRSFKPCSLKPAQIQRWQMAMVYPLQYARQRSLKARPLK